MSRRKQEKIKFTKRMSTKYLTVLSSIFISITLMLWGVHTITAPTIAEHAQITETAAMLEVLHNSYSFERGSFLHVSFVDRDEDETRTFATIDSVHRAFDFVGNEIGFVVLVDAHVEHSEDIRVVVGIRYRQSWDSEPMLEEYMIMSASAIQEFETRAHESIENAVQFALSQVNEIIETARLFTSPQEAEGIIEEITEITEQEVEEILQDLYNYGTSGGEG